MKNDLEVSKQIQMLSRKIKRNLDTTFFRYGLTGVQAGILKFVYDKSKKGKVYAKDIENEFDKRRATIAGIIQLLEQNELIERKSEGKDARMKEIVLTDKALNIVKSINLTINNVEKNLKKDITKEEISNFLETLKKMNNNLRKGEGVSNIC